MSLLHDRDFAVYCLRRSYLDRIHDGVGERVLHVDRALYSRTWITSSTPSSSTPSSTTPSSTPSSKRSYAVISTVPPPPFHPEFQFSPPIPKFVESGRLAANHSNGSASFPPSSSDSSSEFDDSDVENEEREYAEDELDSSIPLSSSKKTTDTNNTDDDDDEIGIEDLQRAARKIKFSKMPARDKDRIPDVDQMLSTYITHQHKSAATTATIPDASPSSYSRHRYRYNYTYASDIGLAGNLDDKEGMTFLRSSSFRRGSSFDKRFNALWSDISMDDAIMEHEDLAASSSVVVGRPPSPSVVAGRPPSRSSSTSFSAAAAAAASSYSFSSPLPPLPPPEAFTPSPELFSPVDSPPRDLTPLHPPVQLKSNLSALITASQAAEKNPFEIYTSASGVGELEPLRLKVYRPSSKQPKQPFDVVVKPYVTVADTIGYALYRYWEEKREPKLSDDEADVSKWTLHIVEDDGEPDLDFPALDRTRIISAFSFDEFALVEATPRQIAENRKLLGSA